MADDSVTIDLVLSGMRAAQWARTKGELRTMVELCGATTPCRAVGDEFAKAWQELGGCVEAFIKEVEENGWHE